MAEQIKTKANETLSNDVESSLQPRSGGRILADALRVQGVDRIFESP